MKIMPIITILLAVLTIIMAIMWVGANNKQKNLAQEKEEISTSFENATKTIGDIQSTLDAIDKDLMGQLSIAGETPGATPEDRKSMIVNSLSNMRSQLEAGKQRISQLERELSQSNRQVAGLQDILNKLRSSVSEKENIVAGLQKELGVLSETLDTERKTSVQEIQKREAQISEKTAQIEQLDQDINTIYYVYGTRKELIEKEIIDRTGGLLGIGRVSVVSKKSNLDSYTPLNLLNESTLRFTAKKKYAILSGQNASSYRVDKDGINYTLVITNPEVFRRIKNLIIEVD
ncbi:MAG: hypothetical protein PHI68_00415 [Candidatus Cloacimonetes bacterium]|nr:hypothetical protein [Candidatus Cloacimonadota bacterium]